MHSTREEKEHQSWQCNSDVESQSTIVWHEEDKRGKAADNGDLDLAAVAAAVWQQQAAAVAC